MQEPCMMIRPVKVTVSLTGSYNFVFFFSFWGACPHPNEKEKKLYLPVKLTVSLTGLIDLLTTPWQLACQAS